MKIIKFIIPSLLLFMPIGVFAEECKDYTEQDACQAAATTSGCYWISGETDVVSGESTSECRQCLDGKYSIETECKECPAGHYCVGGIWARCPAGTYNPNKGSSSVDDCTPCPAGKYSYAGESGCRQCTNMPFNSNGSDPLRAGEYSYLYDEEYGERKSNNCPWKFSCGENLKPKCDLETKTCTCESCGSPYEYSVNKTAASSMIYNGTDFEADPGSVRTCPGFQPLYLYSSEKDSASSDQKKFEFYVILKHGEVLLSATASSNPDDFKNAAQIANVNLSNGLNYTVKFEISDGKNTCTFSSLGCGRQDTETCTVRDIYGDCTYDSIKTIVGDNTEWKLDVKWFLDVPVLIAKKRLEFEDEGKDNTLHITYLKSDDSCFKWAASAGEVVLDKNGEPQLNGTCSANEADINADLDGYNKLTDGQVPFLGYTIGCWWKYRNSYNKDSLLSGYIVLEKGNFAPFLDFGYPPDCSAQYVLPKKLEDVIPSLEKIGNERIWAGSLGYTYESISHTLSNTDDKDLNKRCFIVGLYGYPPCTPGCYCPNGKSTACAELLSPPQSPFYSERGSDERSDCYLKSDVVFKEGDMPVTQSVKDLLGLPDYFDETIRLVE